MPSIVLKDLPAETHQWLKNEAILNRRSMNQQAIHILEQARKHRLPAVPPPARIIKPKKPFTQAWLRKAIEEGRE
jgi:hypothetical protein